MTSTRGPGSPISIGVTIFKVSKLIGAELFNRVNSLGDIDKKEKARLCGYEKYSEFIEAWLQASTNSLGLNFSDGQIVVDASELTDNEQHKAAAINKDCFHELWIHASSEIDDCLEFCITTCLEDGVHKLRRACVLAPASDELGGSYLVARFMSDGDDCICISHIQEKDIISITMEVSENDLWYNWTNFTSTSLSLPGVSYARKTVVNRETREESDDMEIMDEELPDLPIEVRERLHSIMNLGPSFKWDNESDSCKTMLDHERIMKLIGSDKRSEFFSLYSNTLDRSRLIILSIALPQVSVRYWFPH